MIFFNNYGINWLDKKKSSVSFRIRISRRYRAEYRMLGRLSMTNPIYGETEWILNRWRVHWNVEKIRTLIEHTAHLTHLANNRFSRVLVRTWSNFFLIPVCYTLFVLRNIPREFWDKRSDHTLTIENKYLPVECNAPSLCTCYNSIIQCYTPECEGGHRGTWRSHRVRIMGSVDYEKEYKINRNGTLWSRINSRVSVSKCIADSFHDNHRTAMGN